MKKITYYFSMIFMAVMMLSRSLHVMRMQILLMLSMEIGRDICRRSWIMMDVIISQTCLR